MPPRKSEPSRKSDVSDARFVLADDDDDAASGGSNAATEPEPAKSTAPAPAGKSGSGSGAGAGPGSLANGSGAAAAAGAAPVSQASTDKKDKEKDKDVTKDAVTIEDLTLPKSIITRLAKGVLPPNTQIQGNAIMALSKSAIVFVNHLANAANEHTLNSGKKTIMPADVFKALEDIEFGYLREPLEAEFAKFNDVQTSKRNTYRRKVAAAKKAAGGGGSSSGAGGHDANGTAGPAGDDTDLPDASVLTAMSEGGGPRAKKARTDPAADGEDDEVDAETEPEEEVEEDDDEDDEEEEEDDEEGGDEAEEGNETQDALEERRAGDLDEALDDGDESD